MYLFYITSGFNKDYKSFEPLKILVMLSYVMLSSNQLPCLIVWCWILMMIFFYLMQCL